MEAPARITVRLAKVEDAKTLTEICKRAFDSDSAVGSPGPGGPPGYDSVAWNIQRINNRYLQYYKILRGNSIVGGFLAGDRGPGYQVCERIWVDPDHMRNGIGKKAFERIWENYPSADLWTLGTPEWNVRTKAFYEQVGFVQIGITHDLPQWSGRYYEKRITDGFPKAMSRIENLRRDRKRVVVEGRVKGMSSLRTVLSRTTGEELRVADAVLGDDTGSIKLVLWNDQIRQVEENTRIRIEEGYVKEFGNELQLGIGQWGLIITLL